MSELDHESGAARIAKERARQVAVKRYSAEHDDEETDEALVRAALCYIVESNEFVLDVERRTGYGHSVSTEIRVSWPWSRGSGFKPTNRIRNLEKAGALIAAEIDRLIRAEYEELNAPVTLGLDGQPIGGVVPSRRYVLNLIDQDPVLERIIRERIEGAK